MNHKEGGRRKRKRRTGSRSRSWAYPLNTQNENTKFCNFLDWVWGQFENLITWCFLVVFLLRDRVNHMEGGGTKGRGKKEQGRESREKGGGRG